MGFSKVGFDSGFDKNNPKVVKEKVWKKIRYGYLSNFSSILFLYIVSDTCGISKTKCNEAIESNFQYIEPL